MHLPLPAPSRTFGKCALKWPLVLMDRSPCRWANCVQVASAFPRSWNHFGVGSQCRLSAVGRVPVSQAGADCSQWGAVPSGRHSGHGGQARGRASVLSTSLRASLTPKMIFFQDFTKWGSETEKEWEGRKQEMDTSKYSRSTQCSNGAAGAWPHPGGA